MFVTSSVSSNLQVFVFAAPCQVSPAYTKSRAIQSCVVFLSCILLSNLIAVDLSVQALQVLPALVTKKIQIGSCVVHHGRVKISGESEIQIQSEI